MFLMLAAALLVARPLWSLRPIVNHARSVDEVRLLGSIAAELRAGASIRSALVAATSGHNDDISLVVGRMAAAGRPLGDIAAALTELPINGRRAAAALRVVVMAGGRSADVFSRLADRAMEEADLLRERRVQTVQARLSALIIGGIPVVSLLAGGATRVRDLIDAGTGGAVVAAIGLGAQAIGSLLVWRMAAAR